ncbi:hypothetical protein PIB30_001057 [Stylosanthes scabra]|uniref:Uncharacterized protein n=1 Tax=Stylosanthes scabra TaxID=79078 RepID=A0ABU6U430_9FABA|nr:hypothetical protein [Stylosanthes scabra]
MKISSNKLVEQFQVGVAALSIDKDPKPIIISLFPSHSLSNAYSSTTSLIPPTIFTKLPFQISNFLFPSPSNVSSLLPVTSFVLRHHTSPSFNAQNEDSVAFTVAESSLDFNLFASNNPKSINDLRTLAPKLVGKAMHHDHDNVDNGDTLVFPILALKATVFANRGICIAINYCHVMDDRSCGQFMKSWSSLCGTLMRSGEEIESTLLADKFLSPPPCFDREVLKDPKGLESIFLSDYFREWQGFKDKVLKKSNNFEAPQYLSSFVVTSAFLWSALVKTKHRDEANNDDGKVEDCIRFAADVRERLDSRVSDWSELLRKLHNEMPWKGEEEGVEGRRVIEKAINDMKEEPFRGAENWKSTFKKLFLLGNGGLLVAGSHKFGVYDTDFGFGRPMKVEMVYSSRVMSIAESGDSEGGGIEFGMVFRKGEFRAF